MNKRGSDLVETYIVRIILFLGIALILSVFVIKARDDSFYTQRFTTIETSLIKDAILASPGEISLTYIPIKSTSFFFKKSPCVVSTSLTADRSTQTSYPCIKNDIFQEDLNLISKDKITFEKTKDGLKII